MNVKQLNIALNDIQKEVIQSIFDTAEEEENYDVVDYLIYELIEFDDIFDDATRFKIIRETYIANARKNN